ncbi:MAG: GtrA family protein [Eubacteriales bacterium]|nr:GtrA family protein [Eubacteriales bacterium]
MNVKRHTELWRTVKFVLFSASAGVIELLSFSLLNELIHAEYWFSYLTALVLSVLWNFTLNRRFTFKSTTNVPVAMLKVFAYYCVFTPVTTILGNYLVETRGWNEYLVTFINMVFNLITEFLYQKYVVYRNSIDTNELAKKEIAPEESPRTLHI